jgi:hypothetical protein
MNLETIVQSGLVIAVTGVVLTQIFTTRRERRRKFEDERLDSYVSFLDSVTASAFSKDKATMQSTLKAATIAKTKICLWGSKTTIKALADFERSGTALRNEECANAFLALLACMRKDIGINADEADRLDFKEILLSPQDPNHQ